MQSAVTIGNIDSNKEVIINFNCKLCDMNLRGLKVLNSLKTFKNLREEELLPSPIYLVNKFWKSKIEHITIIISILFQLSLK